MCSGYTADIAAGLANGRLGAGAVGDGPPFRHQQQRRALRVRRSEMGHQERTEALIHRRDLCLTNNWHSGQKHWKTFIDRKVHLCELMGNFLEKAPRPLKQKSGQSWFRSWLHTHVDTISNIHKVWKCFMFFLQSLAHTHTARVRKLISLSHSTAVSLQHGRQAQTLLLLSFPKPARSVCLSFSYHLPVSNANHPNT